MALQDKIGREEIVDKICGLVGSLKKDKNFCLAINGAWGSGKSFVLGLIEEKLSKRQEYIIIKYDAWENTFYSDPLIAILSCVLDGLEDKLSKMKGYGKVATDFGKKKGKEIVDKLSESGGKIGFIAKIIKEIFEVIPDLKNVSLVTDTKNNQLEIFKSYKSLLNQIKGLLNKLTEKVFVSNEQTKLVILVDEIDRCLPDEQLKILERLHHLFDVKNCAVIVTMNQTCVAKTVKTIYGIDGYEYLRKFFNFTFRLDTSANEYLKNLLEEYIKSFEKIQVPASDVGIPVKLAYQCLLYCNAESDHFGLVWQIERERAERSLPLVFDETSDRRGLYFGRACELHRIQDVLSAEQRDFRRSEVQNRGSQKANRTVCGIARNEYCTKGGSYR